jgi:quercetin dioxygenase-like cupin family protein
MKVKIEKFQYGSLDEKNVRYHLEHKMGWKVERLFYSPSKTFNKETSPRDRHLLIEKGKLRITMGDDVVELSEGDMFTIPAQQEHLIAVASPMTAILYNIKK